MDLTDLSFETVLEMVKIQKTKLPMPDEITNFPEGLEDWVLIENEPNIIDKFSLPEMFFRVKSQELEKFKNLCKIEEQTIFELLDQREEKIKVLQEMRKDFSEMCANQIMTIDGNNEPTPEMQEIKKKINELSDSIKKDEEEVVMRNDELKFFYKHLEEQNENYQICNQEMNDSFDLLKHFECGIQVMEFEAEKFMEIIEKLDEKIKNQEVEILTKNIEDASIEEYLDVQEKENNDSDEIKEIKEQEYNEEKLNETEDRNLKQNETNEEELKQNEESNQSETEDEELAVNAEKFEESKETKDDEIEFIKVEFIGRDNEVQVVEDPALFN
ncbi:hypothetical protein PVAND_009763 [Polypedilum vanderplanki]|uniref:Uncharacterized protein n=1 Tax=Polypedilum vanderplanki TaxID=319348 RepID=A0A9J6CEJ5_POLVA|nr:hypothetical protein PVAND_009763 [Polypedilum vanderplanki]